MASTTPAPLPLEAPAPPSPPSYLTPSEKEQAPDRPNGRRARRAARDPPVRARPAQPTSRPTASTSTPVPPPPPTSTSAPTPVPAPPPLLSAPSTTVQSRPPPPVRPPKQEPTVVPPDGLDATSVVAARPAQPLPPGPAGSLDEYREGCLKLEKTRHARVFEAEKKRLYHENCIESMYQHTVQTILHDFAQARRILCVKMWYENAEKLRHVEELRYKIVRDDAAATWHRRHEMSLRGRGSSVETPADAAPGRVRSLLEEDGVLADLERDREKEREKTNRRSRKNDNRQKVKLHLEVDEGEALHDLAIIMGSEKRPRDPEPAAATERRSKKRK